MNPIPATHHKTKLAVFVGLALGILGVLVSCRSGSDTAGHVTFMMQATTEPATTTASTLPATTQAKRSPLEPDPELLAEAAEFGFAYGAIELLVPLG
jgi:hypothetical protein